MLKSLSGAVDSVRDAAVDSLGLDQKFKDSSDDTLDEIAPKAADMVVEDAVAFIPHFQKFDDATPRDIDGEAKEVCSSTILSFREKIHDFCEDVVDRLKEGSDPVDMALDVLYKVVSWILRACKEGVQAAVDLLKKVIPDCIEPCCLTCLGLGQKLAEFASTTFNKLVDMVEEIIKAALGKFGVPSFILEKIDFNNSNPDNATDDDEPIKAKKAREAGEAPAEAAPDQEKMPLLAEE